MDAINPDEVIPDAQPVTSSIATKNVATNHDPVAILANEVVPDEPIPADEVKVDNQYNTPEQMAITGLEGIARGASFGLSTKASIAAGENPEDIKGREEENPWIAAGGEAVGTVGSMFIPGVGEGWLLGKAAKAIVPIAENAHRAAKVGRLALRGMLETMGMATGDEISDAFLDKGHDAEGVASHIIGAGALGLLTGGLFGTGSQTLEHMQSAKVGEYLDDWAMGVGPKATDMVKMYEAGSMSVPKGMKDGMKFAQEITEETSKAHKKVAKKISNEVAGTISKSIGATTGAIAGGLTGGLLGPIGATAGAAGGSTLGYKLAEKYLDPFAEKLASKTVPKIVNKVAIPMMLKAIQTGDSVGLIQALNYGTKSASGYNAVNKAIDSLFKVTGNKIIHEFSETDNAKLNKYIEDGGIDQQIQELQDQTPETSAYAEGGVVTPRPIKTVGGMAALYPAQHMMTTAAKGRVSNYLNSIRPQPPISKPILDKHYDDPIKKKSYERALSIANKPLSVLKHIQDGTILPEHVKHLNSMYPEVHDYLSKKITDRLVNHQKDETKPSDRTVQGLSLFLGSALKSSLTPASIQAAQATFAPKQGVGQQQQQVKKPKKGTGTLSDYSKSYETPDQSRNKRMSK